MAFFRSWWAEARETWNKRCEIILHVREMSFLPVFSPKLPPWHIAYRHFHLYFVSYFFSRTIWLSVLLISLWFCIWMSIRAEFTFFLDSFFFLTEIWHESLSSLCTGVLSASATAQLFSSQKEISELFLFNFLLNITEVTESSSACDHHSISDGRTHGPTPEM